MGQGESQLRFLYSLIHTVGVIGTDTVAVRQDDGSFKLHGYKWFTSATDANVAFTLARVQDTQSLVTPVWSLPRICTHM